MTELMNMLENKDSYIHRLEEMMPVTVPQFVVTHYNQLQLENVALKGVLSRIASQKLENEVEAEEWEDADFECAYDAIVREARAVLKEDV